MKIRYSVILKRKLPMEQLDLSQTRRLMDKADKKGSSWEAELERVEGERKPSAPQGSDPEADN
jgi:hypothetical protein